jgi:hypothetical protein
MAGGGRQPGAGRPKGALSKVTAKAKQAAMETGLLPHEWLLMVSRGEGIKHKRWVIKYDAKGNEKSRDLVEEEVYPDLPMRQDSAKAAAPYYAPRLAAQTVDMNATMGVHKLSDEEIDAKLALLAKQLIKTEDDE